MSKNERSNVFSPAEKDRGCDSDFSEDYAAETMSLPPIVHHLSTCVRHARNKITPYNKPPVSSSLELRFTEKLLVRVDSSNITLEDAHKDKSIFLCGLMGLSDSAVHQALAAGQADCEAKHLQALLMAWEIEAADCC
ncbi:hypothetical protein HD554DRAFT_2034426 [Boletus coccyginus]|nr:hypothetical protein HD554DRAFT_2034426 [Boletus coccyginus]